MIFRFCSGSVTPARRDQERVGGVHEVERQVQLLAEPLLDLVRLVVPQQPVVDEDARQTIADRAVHQHRGDGGIHAARQAADHLAGRAHLLPDALGRFLDERGDRPVAAAAAHVEGEAPQDVLAVLGVHDLRVEQQPVERRARAPPSRRSAPCCSSRRSRSRRGTPPTSSPWLAQTRNSSGTPANSRGAPPPPATCTCACPNSRWPERRTSPPSRSVISCMP